jgi:hypothetical protein
MQDKKESIFVSLICFRRSRTIESRIVQYQSIVVHSRERQSFTINMFYPCMTHTMDDIRLLRVTLMIDSRA